MKCQMEAEARVTQDATREDARPRLLKCCPARVNGSRGSAQGQSAKIGRKTAAPGKSLPPLKHFGNRARVYRCDSRGCIGVPAWKGTSEAGVPFTFLFAELLR
jgi:hypothetical protein